MEESEAVEDMQALADGTSLMLMIGEGMTLLGPCFFGIFWMKLTWLR